MADERTDIDVPISEIHFAEEPDVDAPPGQRSRSLRRRQQSIESGIVKYPLDIPLAFEEARGSTIRDVDGNTYLDFFATISVLNVGHANPYVLEGAQDQLGKLAHSLDFPAEPRLNLIEKVNETLPDGLRDNNRVMFAGPTGTNTIEGTIKLAMKNTGNDSLIAFRGAYHGATFGAMSLSSSRSSNRTFGPFLPKTNFVPYPTQGDDSVTVDEAIEEARSLLEDDWRGVSDPAGIWIEPIQAPSGVSIPADGFIPRLRELADEHEIPLISDEIQAGFGRTGNWWACEWEGVTPDIITTAKSIGGVGLPLAATVYHDDYSMEPGDHGGTFRGNLPAMRAGVRAIEYIQHHDLLSHATELGELMRDRFREVQNTTSNVEDVRGRGLLIGVELVDGDGHPSKAMADSVLEYCYKNGVLISTAGQNKNVLRIMPPLVTTTAQAEVGSDIICEAITSAADQHSG